MSNVAFLKNGIGICDCFKFATHPVTNTCNSSHELEYRRYSPREMTNFRRGMPFVALEAVKWRTGKLKTYPTWSRFLACWSSIVSSPRGRMNVAGFTRIQKPFASCLISCPTLAFFISSPRKQLSRIRSSQNLQPGPAKLQAIVNET